ncbi:MAG: Beta-ketoadipate enol-lactone hydrolase [uncultured Rubrobacteraceae bacterium]|uniref:Beta-ketoadipate enol-lactone hydrolase n=1 Tax=uncultured Rubrobacteraceae bacterium TaxID=349277 RepID=A0A6J4SI90_9ACTN|nr:MAG: Beta-ketoadipate enol-lactone hydrolase [uncultured Rubrobacteraceae bacterium]
MADLTGEAVALLDHLGVGKTHVLGTSLGGFVAQELALVRPDLVDRLVLVCTSYGGRGPQAMSPGALADMMGVGTFSAEAAARKALAAATGEAYRAEKPEEFERIVRWRLADSPSVVSYYEQAKAGARFDLSGDVGHITSPTLVIHGAEDRYVPPANARALAEAIPGARLQMLEDAGHLVFVERFADVNREVVRFLRSGTTGARETGRGAGDGAVGEASPEAGGWLWRSTGSVRGWVARTMAAMWAFLGFRD